MWHCIIERKNCCVCVEDSFSWFLLTHISPRLGVTQHVELKSSPLPREWRIQEHIPHSCVKKTFENLCSSFNVETAELGVFSFRPTDAWRDSVAGFNRERDRSSGLIDKTERIGIHRVLKAKYFILGLLWRVRTVNWPVSGLFVNAMTFRWVQRGEGKGNLTELRFVRERGSKLSHNQPECTVVRKRKCDFQMFEPSVLFYELPQQVIVTLSSLQATHPPSTLPSLVFVILSVVSCGPLQRKEGQRLKRVSTKKEEY